MTRVLAYGFAFYLLFLEWLMRALSNIDSHDFVGPTLAAAGVGFIVPLTTAKNSLLNFSNDTQQQLNGYYAISKREQIAVDVLRLFLLVLTVSWAYDVYLVIKKSSGLFGISAVRLGFITYFTAVILSEVKEGVRWKS